MSFPETPIIELDFIDSTNNYAMRLIDADKAHDGMTIVAQSQTGGKGQRGKTWMDEPGKSLLMSTIVTPAWPLNQQFVFSASIAAGIANILQNLYKGWVVNIKWPNDIIINDKKAGGILIENVIRGTRWTHSVVGLGLNVHQDSFPAELPYATSLKIGSGKDFNITDLAGEIRGSIWQRAILEDNIETILQQYNNLLYKKGCKQSFFDSNARWNTTILRVLPNGLLEVQLEQGDITLYQHGQVTWEYR